MAAEETIGFLLGDVSRRFRQGFELAIAGEGLEITAGEARTLFNVARNPGIRQTALAERMSIEPMTVVNFLDRLEARGWIKRDADPADRRAKRVRATAAARPLVERLDVIAADVRARATAGISERDMAALRRSLEAMRMNMSELTDEKAA